MVVTILHVSFSRLPVGFVGQVDQVVRIFVSRLVKLGRGVNDVGDAEGLWAEIIACTRPRPERARALLIVLINVFIQFKALISAFIKLSVVISLVSCID